MVFAVRPLQASDSIETLTALLHRAHAPLGAMGLNYTAVDQSVETTAQRARGGYCLVAEQGGTIVGTVVVQGPRIADDTRRLRRRRGDALAGDGRALRRRGLDRARQRRVPRGLVDRRQGIDALADGRVHALIEVTQDGVTYFNHARCTFRGALIAEATEHWATAEVPPAWRNAAALGPGYHHDG